jgi:uncharacterized protein YkwD
MCIFARRVCSGLAVCLLLLISLHAAPTSAGSATLSSGSSHVYLPIVTGGQTSSLVTLAQRVVDLTNVERAAKGCPALTISPALSEAAEQHSRDMALNDLFSHAGSNGSSVADRLAEVGYSWSNYAENIAAGASSPEDVLNMWMGSPGHRDNILNCNLREIGIGFYDQPDDQPLLGYSFPFRYYWTQDFGSPRS